MKQVAITPCQIIQKSGKIITLAEGETIYYKDEHPHLRPIQTEEAPKDTPPIDFDTAGEEELLESDFDLKDLKEYIIKTYKKKPRNRNRLNTIKLLLDCRYRSIDIDLTKVV